MRKWLNKIKKGRKARELEKWRARRAASRNSTVKDMLTYVESVGNPLVFSNKKDFDVKKS